jgi:hypothetical protein
MKTLFHFSEKNVINYVLAILMAVFIVFPINVPTKIAQLINTSTGKITLAFVVLNVFLKNHILGVMTAIASYELIKRSAGHGSIFSGLNKKFLPSEKSKTSNLNKYNQFPYTVEELIINKRIPYSFNLTNPSSLSSPFKPLEGDSHDAENISEFSNLS